ncbi:hypothetical protein M758_5G004400 [Ceratodon purpureus]|uniref:Uncharacterized protein n=1 Tax=Ceratodon purpureus TaxID=3225 RepID=A0A8T0HWD4_CERPU|nr:hypothetical protein KC19_5G003500 [Ceratodon purpureus]KAG0614960.1 hypothetical protein M758_5G004400 [Ceratodon purpureus]
MLDVLIIIQNSVLDVRSFRKQKLVSVEERGQKVIKRSHHLKVISIAARKEPINMCGKLQCARLLHRQKVQIQIALLSNHTWANYSNISPIHTNRIVNNESICYDSGQYSLVAHAR